jgi:hypothetical protein
LKTPGKGEPPNPYHGAVMAMATWVQLVARKEPKAYFANRVIGNGHFALTTCAYEDGVHFVYFYSTEVERDLVAAKNPKCRAPHCTGDHRKFNLIDRLCGFCEKTFAPVGDEIFCSSRCKRLDDKSGPTR